MSVFNKIAFLFVIIGALNWGLIGAFDLNLITKIFVKIPQAIDIVYILIGVSGLLLLLAKLRINIKD
jgi:uncharacterized protein